MKAGLIGEAWRGQTGGAGSLPVARAVPLAANQPAADDGVWIELRGPGLYLEEVQVQCRVHTRNHATRETPEEGGYEIERVRWRGIDIRDALTASELAHIACQLAEGES
jgi:hypothetical protein